MKLPPPVPCLLAALAAVGLSACQSTQDRSAELAKSGGKLLEQEDLEIAKASTDVEVTETAIFPAADGTTYTVAVRLENSSDKGLINVPIQIDVRDAKGKSIFRNDTAGTEPSLTSVAVIEPGAEVWWVHDSVFPAGGEPEDVKVELGDAPDPFPELPEIEIDEPKLIKNPALGLLEAKGEVDNLGSEDLKDVYFYGVATKGSEVVAAGRAAVDKLKPNPRIVPEYNIFMSGDPEGAEISVNFMPTYFEE